MTTDTTILAFIGAGNMASAIIGGLVTDGYPSDQIIAADPSPESLEKVADAFGVQTRSNNNKAIAKADVVILAVKPQHMQTVCKDIAQQIQQSKPLVISIAAGITCAHLESWLGDNLAIVRCMPNTPALLKAGATGLYANNNVNSWQQDMAYNLLEAVGIAVWVDQEDLLDSVTAVSGSGPAYFFLFMEHMQNKAEELGLPEDVARALVLQTALGAAKMACESGDEPAELRRKVSSPNGTTEAAIKNFASNKLEHIIQQAMQSAFERSKALAEELGKSNDE